MNDERNASALASGDLQPVQVEQGDMSVAGMQFAGWERLVTAVAAQSGVLRGDLDKCVKLRRHTVQARA